MPKHTELKFEKLFAKVSIAGSGLCLLYVLLLFGKHSYEGTFSIVVLILLAVQVHLTTRIISMAFIRIAEINKDMEDTK